VLVVPELESYTPRAQPGGARFEMPLPPPRRRPRGGVQKPPRRAAPQHASAISRVPEPEAATPGELTHLRWRGRKVSDELMRYAERTARGEELAPFTGPILAEPRVETSRLERRRSEARTREQEEPAPSNAPGARWLLIIAASVTCIAAALLPLDNSAFERATPSVFFLEPSTKVSVAPAGARAPEDGATRSLRQWGPEASPEAPEPPSDASPDPPSRSSRIAPTPATRWPAPVSTTVPGKLTPRRARVGDPPRTRGPDAEPTPPARRALFVEAAPF
jgi:hypothetical protein